MPPPRLAMWCLRYLAGRNDARYLLSDLREEYDAIARERGRRAAGRWYWAQALRSVGPLLQERLAPLRRGRLSDHFRHALRVFRRSPGTTAVIVVTLALGIGANAAMFSVIDAVLFQPLSYRAPDRLAAVWEATSTEPRISVAPADLVDYERLNRSFEDLACYVPASMMLTRSDPPEQLWGEIATWNLLPLLGARPAIGRGLTPDDDRPGAQHVVILSDGIWRSRFGGDAGILGRAITLNNLNYVVIGVLPPGFQSLTELGSTVRASFFMPAGYTPDMMTSRDHEVQVVGRLRAGIPVEAARRDLQNIAAYITHQLPPGTTPVRVDLALLGDDVVRNVRTSLVIMLGAVGLVVLIACVNVASLLIVWAIDERRDVAIRVALGASRADIVAEFLVRGLTLAALGGAGGLLLGTWLRDELIHLAPASIPRLASIALNGRVLTMTIVLTLATGLFSGLVPAMQVVRRRVAPSLKSSGLTGSAARELMWWRGALLTAELAAAVVLALGAGLLVRSLMALNGTELGFDTQRVLTMAIKLPPARYPDAPSRLRFFDRLAEQLKTLPGAADVAFADQFPMRGGWGGRLLVLSDFGPIPAEADLQAVSASYFSTLGIGVLRGRRFLAVDQPGAPPVAVVSQTFVARYLKGRDPLGAQIQRSPEAPVVTIIGVVGEVRRDGKFSVPTPQVYFPAAQTSLYAVPLSALAVRAASDPQPLVGGIRRAVSAIDPDQAITNIRTLDDILSASVASRRFDSWLLTSFALLALTLALIGVYGVIAHIAAQRAGEIGIRVALGATKGQVVGLVIRTGLRWAAVGIAVGVAVAYIGAQALTTLLFGIAPTDPLTFGLVTVLMFVVTVAASYVPARRAANGDPVSALRGEGAVRL
jgi:putative ABC transport system permease protein